MTPPDIAVLTEKRSFPFSHQAPMGGPYAAIFSSDIHLCTKSDKGNPSGVGYICINAERAGIGAPPIPVLSAVKMLLYR